MNNYNSKVDLVADTSIAAGSSLTVTPSAMTSHIYIAFNLGAANVRTTEHTVTMTTYQNTSVALTPGTDTYGKTGDLLLPVQTDQPFTISNASSSHASRVSVVLMYK